ncbi:hypothetical protein BH11PAT1_BH11PAT1_6450 [soil metagenome]
MEESVDPKAGFLYNTLMAKKGEHRITIGLVCSVCKSRNYVSQKNKMETPAKLLLKKFCKFCRKVTDHKENEKLK